MCVAATRAEAQATRPSPRQEGKILVLPFTALNPAENQTWLGRSIQQSLVSDLTMAAPGRVISADLAAPDTASAVAAGRKADAAYVVPGSFITLNTSAGQGLRLMGQVIDVNAAAPVAAFKATGLSSEIFRLEDQVSAQIRQQLAAIGAIAPPPIASAPPSQPQSNEPTASTYQPANEYYQAYGTPQTYVPAGTTYNYYYSNPSSYSYPDYGYGAGYGYGYPGYGWGVGWPWWWGGGLVVVGGFHDHGFNHGHFNSGGFGHGGFGHGGFGHFGGGVHMGGGGAHFGGGGAHFGGGGAHFGGGGGHMGGGGGHR